MESIDSIETYAYGMIKDLVHEKYENKCINIIILKIFNFDTVTKE